MALRFSVARRDATADEVDAAFARLDGAPGLYFGSDAGVAGLHPAQATLLAEASVALRIHADGAEAEALDAFGAALLGHPDLQAFRDRLGRRPGGLVFDAARAFLAAFEGPRADIALLGALRFEAHRLGARDASGEPLGVLFFGTTALRRDAAGRWEWIELGFDDAGLERARQAAAARAVTPAIAPAITLQVARAIAPGVAPDAAESRARDETPADDFPPGGYADVVERARAWLAREPLVSLTLSQSFRRRADGIVASRAFANLRRANPAPATFFINTGAGERLFGASPDLQLQVRAGTVESFPVCGTIARGHGPVGEADALRRLFDEEVDAASLAVCSDALRNDLAPLCEPGSLRLLDRRRPMSLATVVHAVDRLAGRLRAGVDAWDAIVATAAPVMLTGTPRRHALAAIAALEASPRGWYGGLVVEVDGAGDARVGTILRAAVLRDGVAEVRTGGDLMADSDPLREEHESRLKAVSLWRALGLAVDPALQQSIAGVSATALPTERLPSRVGLHDAGDPFAAAMADVLEGFGLVLDADAVPAVLIGADAARCADVAARGAVVAVGDAAARLLQQSGFAVVETAPQHGRPLQCVPNASAPWAERRPFSALRYSTLALEATAEGRLEADPAWAVWAHDEEGRPLVLAHAARRVVCMLFRPDSLLADPLALVALRAAIAFAAA